MLQRLKFTALAIMLSISCSATLADVCGGKQTLTRSAMSETKQTSSRNVLPYMGFGQAVMVHEKAGQGLAQLKNSISTKPMPIDY